MVFYPDIRGKSVAQINSLFLERPSIGMGLLASKASYQPASTEYDLSIFFHFHQASKNTPDPTCLGLAQCPHSRQEGRLELPRRYIRNKYASRTAFHPAIVYLGGALSTSTSELFQYWKAVMEEI